MLDPRNVMSVDNDADAEELILWLKEQSEIRDRLIAADKAMIDRYQQKLIQHQEGYENTVATARQVLGAYCREHFTKQTKTETKLLLPSGKVYWKKRAPEVVRDDQMLLDWLGQHNLDCYVTVTTKCAPDWKELKAKAVENGDHYELPDANGEMARIPGVYLVERPDELKVEVE